ncbi:ABC transporter ATP-binding protein [Sesbania bispinosa]|nr:ABC transporter ATP-binding protein [Sesbania bispinosa]
MDQQHPLNLLGQILLRTMDLQHPLIQLDTVTCFVTPQDNPSQNEHTICAQPSQNISKGKSKATGSSNVATGKKGLNNKYVQKTKTGSSNPTSKKVSTKSAPTTLPGPDSTNVTASLVQSTTSERIQLLQNIHNTTLFMQESSGQALPPTLVETNNIIRELMDEAKKFYAINDTTQTAAEGGGTQHSEVASTHMGINNQKGPNN